MQRWTTFALRAAFIIGFLVVLPVIALPSVARVLDELLYGVPQSTIPLAPQTESSLAPRSDEPAHATPAAFELPLSDDSNLPPDAERIPAVPPPEFRSVPDFLPRTGSTPSKPISPKSASEASSLDEATARKIDTIRSRLEELGADYVRLEMSEDGLNFHCQCDMPLESGSGKMQSFEATRNAPVAAAEAVLDGVEAWRREQSSPAEGAKTGPERAPR